MKTPLKTHEEILSVAGATVARIDLYNPGIPPESQGAGLGVPYVVQFTNGTFFIVRLPSAADSFMLKESLTVGDQRSVELELCSPEEHEQWRSNRKDSNRKWKLAEDALMLAELVKKNKSLAFDLTAGRDDLAVSTATFEIDKLGEVKSASNWRAHLLSDPSQKVSGGSREDVETQLESLLGRDLLWIREGEPNPLPSQYRIEGESDGA